jgi:hypothetical protein
VKGLATLPGIKSWGKVRRAPRVYDDAQFADDDFPPGFMEFKGSVQRASDSMPGVSEADAAALDTLLERNGLRAILKTLRELCDSRCSHDGEGVGFEDLEGGEQWTHAARELETFLHREQVNVR